MKLYLALRRLTIVESLLTLRNMEIHLHPDLQAKLNRVAAENNSGAREYVQRLVEHCVDRMPGFASKRRKGWTNSTGEGP